MGPVSELGGSEVGDVAAGDATDRCGGAGGADGRRREVAWHLACDAQAASIARRRVASTLDDWAVVLAPARRHDLALAVSELVTNAVMHTATSTIAVTLRHTVTNRHGRVAIEVHDDDTDGEVAIVDPALAPGRLGGQGLRVVDQVADRWGSRPTEAGKTVWLEVDTTTTC